MKYLRIFALLLFAAVIGHSQTAPPCTTFDNGQLNGWTTTNAIGSVVNGGNTHPSSVAELQDDSGPSTFNAPSAYHGDWIRLSGGCGELCFEVNILDDGHATSNPFMWR